MIQYEAGAESGLAALVGAQSGGDWILGMGGTPPFTSGGPMPLQTPYSRGRDDFPLTCFDESTGALPVEHKEHKHKENTMMSEHKRTAFKRGLLIVAGKTVRSARILLGKLGEGVLELAKVWFGKRKEA